MLHDLFICHATEDKDGFVRPLANALKKLHLEVWYDEFSLKLGDSIRRAIDLGLRQSRFGVVVLSNSFFNKQWPQYELDGLVEMEMRGNDLVILPIWHGIDKKEVMTYSPSLANKKAISSAEGIQKIVSKIAEVVRPKGSPLIEARDVLIDSGINPPVITDEYWLHVIEASNRIPMGGARIPEESAWGRWTFPLPPKGDTSKEWGERLAWTAMQLEWEKAADEIPISPISHPQDVHNFIDSHVGLSETCQDFPGLLIDYAPQLVIHGMEGKFKKTIEKLYQDSLNDYQNKTEAAVLCSTEFALRHPTFGGHKDVYVAHRYFQGELFGPHIAYYEHFDHAVWLLSSGSYWLPQKIRSFLITGMANWHVWPEWKLFYEDNPFFEALYNAVHNNEEFRWTKMVTSCLINRIDLSINKLKLLDTSQSLLNRLKRHKFIELYIKSKREYNNRQLR